MRRAYLVFVRLVLVHFTGAGSYDPLVVDPKFHPKVRDLTVHDAACNRDIPVRIYFPHKHRRKSEPPDGELCQICAVSCRCDLKRESKRPADCAPEMRPRN
jgi:hypothetical protein